jgi:hypothetical protein
MANTSLAPQRGLADRTGMTKAEYLFGILQTLLKMSKVRFVQEIERTGFKILVGN